MAHLDDKIKLENYKFDSNKAEHFAVWQSNIENMVRTIANGKPLIDGMHLLAIMWHADPAPVSQNTSRVKSVPAMVARSAPKRPAPTLTTTSSTEGACHYIRRTTKQTNFDVLHQIFNHCSKEKVVQTLAHCKGIKVASGTSDLEDEFPCVACLLGRSKTKPIRTSHSSYAATSESRVDIIGTEPIGSSMTKHVSTLDVSVLLAPPAMSEEARSILDGPTPIHVTTIRVAPCIMSREAQCLLGGLDAPDDDSDHSDDGSAEDMYHAPVPGTNLQPGESGAH